MPRSHDDLRVHVDTVRKWRRRYCIDGWTGSGTGHGRDGSRFTPIEVAEVKALACSSRPMPACRWPAGGD